MMHDLNKGLIYCIQKIKQKPDQNRKISTKLTGLSKNKPDSAQFRGRPAGIGMDFCAIKYTIIT